MSKIVEGTTYQSGLDKLDILVTGTPKIGKTSLLRTLPLTDDSKLVYIGADPGELALQSRKFKTLKPANGVITVQFLQDLYLYCLKWSKDMEWLVVDGLDDIAKAVLAERIENNRNDLKAYGEMNKIMESWIKRMRDIPGVRKVFITHIMEDKDDKGRIVYKPSMPGQEINKGILGWFDLILCMRWVEFEGRPVRAIQANMESDPNYICGDRSGVLTSLCEPDLGVIVSEIETKIGVAPKDKGINPVNVLQLRELVAAQSPEKQKELTEKIVSLKKKYKKERLEDFIPDEWKDLMSQVIEV